MKDFLMGIQCYGGSIEQYMLALSQDRGRRKSKSHQPVSLGFFALVSMFGGRGQKIEQNQAVSVPLSYFY
jgi:hypothetical protein